MLRWLAVCAALACGWADAQPPQRVVLGQLEIEGVPPVPQEFLSRLRPFQNTRQANFLGWIGDGILIGTRFGNTTQLHRVEIPMGARRQLTFFNEPVAAAHVSPKPAPDPQNRRCGSDAPGNRRSRSERPYVASCPGSEHGEKPECRGETGPDRVR